MSLPRYPEYKPAGIEWAAVIPASWRVGRLRWYSRRYSGGTPDKNNSDYWTEGTIPWLNSGAVNDAVIREPSAFITQSAFDNSSAKWIPAGALVLALAGQGKTKGMVAQVAFETTRNQSMAAMDALAAHTTMSQQALDSQKVREGLKDVLLGPARLYESLRDSLE